MSRPEHTRTLSTNLSGASSSRALEGRIGIVTGASRGAYPGKLQRHIETFR